jgi:hypothetical protein
MKTIRTILTMMVLVALFSCGEKKQAAQEHYQQACDRYTDAYATLQTNILEYRQATGQE